MGMMKNTLSLKRAHSEKGVSWAYRDVPNGVSQSTEEKFPDKFDNAQYIGNV